MNKLKITYRNKEILENNPIVAHLMWYAMCFIAIASLILMFLLLPFLMSAHLILYIVTLGKVKLIEFEQ